MALASVSVLPLSSVQSGNHKSFMLYKHALMDFINQPHREYNDRPVPGKPGGPGAKQTLSMQSRAWLDNLSRVLMRVVDEGLDGDVFETGIWRGGTSIFMVGVLSAYERLRGRTPRRHYYFWDSFEGFGRKESLRLGSRLSSAPGADSSLKDLDKIHNAKFLMAPLERVNASFHRSGLLSERVHFVKGYFEDTVPAFGRPRRPLSLLRLDGDLYSSTQVVLNHFYSHIQPGGWVVVDDYLWMTSARARANASSVKLCHEAIDEFRLAGGITAALTTNYTGPGGVSWQV